MGANSQIAIIGMACRLPGGADNPESLWSMLAEGRDGRTEIPKDRWNWKSFYHKDTNAKEAINFSHGYFLDQDISAFDARFFGVPGAEAPGIDPQQRLLLEVTYEAVENAGIPIEDLRGSDTSVHMAMFARDYDRMGYRDTSQMHKQHSTGSGDAILANRISYLLDLKGTSNTLDTGCSGGLVAVHQACRTLKANEASIALAGASQLLLTPDQSMTMFNLTNKDGRCYTFDDRGAGYARGEGLGVLVLKRLEQAIADGDAIHAIIMESGSNHDGKTGGIFLPNSDAQESLARRVYANAGLDPRETLYVEAHGTGTAAGDNAEVSSISKVFGREAGRKSDLPIGSIKANIGHLESSSGIAGMLKAIMVLKKNQIPPQLNLINPKPSLHLAERGIRIPLKLEPLAPKDHTGPRRASLNSFGYGGSNAHVIIQAYDPTPISNGFSNGVNGVENPHETPQRLVVLSANSESSLKGVIVNLRRWLGSDLGRSTSFEDLVYTLNVRRSKLPWRCSAIVSNSEELEMAMGDPRVPLVKSAQDVGVAFVFTGQGAQWFAMGRELLSRSKVFQDSLAACDRILNDLGCDWSLFNELSRDMKTTRLGDSRFSQPSTTAIQIALVDLLGSFGIHPQAVCGHSSGEIAAAYAAGALSKEDAISVAYNRGIWSAEARSLNATAGTMLAVGEGEDAVQKRINSLSRGSSKIVVACVNSPESTTISGDVEAIEELQANLDASSVFNRRLKVDSAYHSHHMETVADSYLSSLAGMSGNAPNEKIAFYSSVTGNRKLSDFKPSYWVSNLVSQVKFSAASQSVAEHLSTADSTASNILIEIGPHSALSGPLRQSLGGFKTSSGAAFKYTYLPCLVRNESATKTILALAGRAFEAGHSTKLDAVTNMDRELTSKPRQRVVDNLPAYLWDHSSAYWHESRLSKENRLRPFPRHDLLGLYDIHSSANEPRWRHHVSIESLPWLKDHVVEGFIIFPGVGYLIMVIEAMKQLAYLRKTPGNVKSVNFRDVSFAKPVVVHQEGENKSREVEMQLVISPQRQHMASTWESFRILSYDAENDLWTENCTGMASLDIELGAAQPAVEEVLGTSDDGLGHLTKSAAAAVLEHVRAACLEPIDTAKVYRELAASGNEYGSSFQGLKDIRVSKNHGFAKIVIDDVAKQMPAEYMQPHTIHPTAFDAIIQLGAVVFRRECVVAPIMPVTLGELSVALDMASNPGSEIFVALHLVPESRREAVVDFCAYQQLEDGTFRPVVTSKDIRPQAVGNADSSNNLFHQKTSYLVEWKPDVDYITQTGFMDHLSSRDLFDVGYGTIRTQPAEEQLHLNDQVASIFIRRAVQRLRQDQVSEASSPHLTQLLDWMRRWDEVDARPLLEGMTPEKEAETIAQASDSNILGHTLTRLGPQYIDILMGRAEPLELLVEDNLLGRLYSDYAPFSCHYAQMGEYMQTLVHKDPNMKILEIGAGTGGATMPLMEKSERDGQLLLANYTYTDISSGFFERARAKFSKWVDKIDFKTLDISSNPLSQGFTAQSFDLIVASIVLHATPSMDDTMANVRKLLKPGGRLVLMELTRLSAAHNGIFGTLEGWWLSQDGRKDGPVLTTPKWDSLLKRHGFSGTDLAIPAHLGRSRDISTFIVSRAVDSTDTSLRASVVLRHSDPTQIAFQDLLCKSLLQQGVECNQEVSSKTGAPVADKIGAESDRLLIVLDPASHPVLLDPKDETFEWTKQVLLQTKNILWVGFQDTEASVESESRKNIVNGLARVFRRENPGIQLITVDVQQQIQPSSEDVHHVVKALTDLAISSFWSNPGGAVETEYTIRDDKLVIPRIVPDIRFADFVESSNDESHDEEGSRTLVDWKYLDDSRPLMFEVRVPGLLNTIRFVDNDKMSEPLGPDQIEVQARAYGLNFKDVFIALGQMAPGTAMTGEVAGVVTAVGSDVQSLWKPGDRVVGLMVAAFGNRVRVNSNGVVAIPDSVSFVDASSVPIIYYTAWYSLTHCARLEKGQSVLIHAASGGVGQAAIQLAQLVGANIFATVGSIAKKKLIQDRYGVPEHQIFSSHSSHFKKHIMEATQGAGVDVVLNSLSGQLLMDSWDCVAPFGTFLEIGKADIYARSQLNMANFEKQATFAAVDTSHMYRLRPEYMTRGLKEIFDMIENGLLKPVYPVTTYDMSRIEECFRLIATRKHIGKLVLVADENTIVQATKPKPKPLRLHQEGTYVIGGGFGDLGKKMSKFLAEKGAGNIVALTRRDVDAQQRAPFEETIVRLGGRLHIVKCDITDERSTLAAREEIRKLPPVKGVIQGALVLCDHPLEYMKLEDWRTAVDPKVQGTLNMDKAFCSPETTDFFIMLSSVTSKIGLTTQSNYAAGCAFQDAFAQAHASSVGASGTTHYMTINVGAVEGSDQIARASSDFIRYGGSVTLDEFFATLEYAMGDQSRIDGASQCIMPFDRDSMEDGMGPEVLNDHLFDHVPSKRRRGGTANNTKVDNAKPSATQAVQEVETVAEAEEIVKQALLDKFAAFLGGEVPDDQPVATLGLDSLVSIELKNWVRHTFQAPLQTSELSGARSIMALANLIVSRMELKCRVNGKTAAGNGDANHHDGQDDTSLEASGEHASQHGYDCCNLSAELPVQPIPELDDALDFWLEANEHLYDPDQLLEVHQDIEALRAPDGPARQILDGLVKEHGHDKSNGWLNEIVTDARWLCRRSPIAPYASTMGGHRDAKTPQSQAERAATIIASSLSFKRAVKAGKVKPLEVAGRPECTWRWGWLFNSIRIPQLRCDAMKSFDSDEKDALDHIAVLRRGHLFKVMLQDRDGQDLSFSDLVATFEEIVSKVGQDHLWTSILTTDDRDSWAIMREKLATASAANAEYFHTMDSAMCVLCLDDGSPETGEEIARQGYIGDGSNRWFDKVLQFYVTSNGRSGQITEHGIIDGTTPARLLEWLSAAMDKPMPESPARLNGNSSSHITLHEFVLETTPEVENRIGLVRKQYVDNTSVATYVREELTEFGTDFLVGSRVSAKGVVDITFQLALRLFFGHNVPSWEPTSAAHFHTGRSDAVQRAVPAVVAFCDAAAQAYRHREESEQAGRLAALLSAATKKMNVDMQTMLNGRSYLRLFEVLSYLWPAEAGSPPKPRFLGEHVFFGRPHPPVFAQSNGLEGDIMFQDFVHLMADTDGFWSILVPEKDRIRFSLTGGSQERTRAFVKELRCAARIVRGILQGVQ
ncbi:Highly reducing polyketide synthase AFT9-1 [Colletotrichum siamense]|uniref:Highly reducing polyketide synthase AFT9-1 n=1 Tax=Colletotrichum siamense TaxID=690259 RepID=A0A9P5F3F9_COLSI|nr:Highly reducing polyketide synthase AFT9-1 [Colletotrichum siamense]KAF4867030.1 Highly reducing polyketide synthase AFT9-1 [Colletotrichum siamense]